eukprot:15467375-Alexandrium_andersonii.AAC.1
MCDMWRVACALLSFGVCVACAWVSACGARCVCVLLAHGRWRAVCVLRAACCECYFACCASRPFRLCTHGCRSALDRAMAGVSASCGPKRKRSPLPPLRRLRASLEIVISDDDEAPCGTCEQDTLLDAPSAPATASGAASTPPGPPAQHDGDQQDTLLDVAPSAPAAASGVACNPPGPPAQHDGDQQDTRVLLDAAPSAPATASG